MQIPVTRDKHNISNLILLDIQDVLFIVAEDRNVVYHTLDGKYYHLLPALSVLETHMKERGFERLDRINLVNSNRVRCYDHTDGKVYFEKAIDKSSKYATVAFANKAKLKHMIESWVKINNDN